MEAEEVKSIVKDSETKYKREHVHRELKHNLCSYAQ